MTAAINPLLAWMILCLKGAMPGVTHIGALDLEDQVSVDISKSWRQIVLQNPTYLYLDHNYIIKEALLASPYPSVKNYVTPAERLEVHKLSLCQMRNMNWVENIPNIWKMNIPLPKKYEVNGGGHIHDQDKGGDVQAPLHHTHGVESHNGPDIPHIRTGRGQVNSKHFSVSQPISLHMIQCVNDCKEVRHHYQQQYVNHLRINGVLPPSPG